MRSMTGFSEYGYPSKAIMSPGIPGRIIPTIILFCLLALKTYFHMRKKENWSACDA